MPAKGRPCCAVTRTALESRRGHGSLFPSISRSSSFGAGTPGGIQGSWGRGQGFRVPTIDLIFVSLSQVPNMVLDPEDILACE